MQIWEREHLFLALHEGLTVPRTLPLSFSRVSDLEMVLQRGSDGWASYKVRN
jgi:hypothetical protein